MCAALQKRAVRQVGWPLSEVGHQSHLDFAKRGSSSARLPARGAKVLMCVCEGLEGSSGEKGDQTWITTPVQRRGSGDLAKSHPDRVEASETMHLRSVVRRPPTPWTFTISQERKELMLMELREHSKLRVMEEKTELLAGSYKKSLTLFTISHWSN